MRNRSVTTLLFAGRWLWLPVAAISLSAGIYVVGLLTRFQDSAQLSARVAELRSYQDQMLQVYVGPLLTGSAPGDESARIQQNLDTVRDDVETLKQDLWKIGIPRTSVAALDKFVETLVSIGALAPGGDATFTTAGDLFADPATFASLAFEYASLVSESTEAIDTVLNGIGARGQTLAAELRIVGTVGVAWLLLGGLASAAGLALSGRRARALRLDAERARELGRMKSDFVGLASHELRTPLAGIFGFAELLSDDDTLPAYARGWSTHIHQESERLTRIVDTLLNITRIESGLFEAHLEALDVPDVARIVVERFAHLGDDHRIELRAPETMLASADAGLLIEVLNNVVENAIKYSPFGGTVLLEITGLDGDVRIAVQDHGLGIPPDQVGKVFERFHRVERVGHEAIRGTGIGLYLVKEAMELMGGTVTVSSTEGVGSVFSLTLPELDMSAMPASTPSAA